MKRKKSEKNNFPYNMLKTFGMEQDTCPDDIYDTALYVLHLIDNSENQQNTEILLMYFKDGKNNKEIETAFQVSVNKVRSIILLFGEKIRRHERYQTILLKGRSQYEQEYSREEKLHDSSVRCAFLILPKIYYSIADSIQYQK